MSRVLPFDVVVQSLVVRLDLFVLVSFDVFGQVVTAHKPFATVRTNEPLLARVSPQVSLQLVRAREALATEQPVTHKRPFSRVPAQVRLQVRSFAINFSTAGYVTDVLFFLPRLVVGVGRLAVGTATPPAPPSRGQGGFGVQEGGDLRLVLRKVCVPQHEAPLQRKPVWRERGRVSEGISLLKTPPRDVLSRVRGQLSLLLVDQAGVSRDKTWHSRGHGGGRRVCDGGHVCRGTCGLQRLHGTR